MQRRLAAIVHADIAGFTRMMEGSETRTFRHLKTAQIEVWRPAIQAANGRLVGTAGDAMLAEFGSAVTAVSAALDIQERMAKFNDTIEPEQRMNFRIGVHLGEVIVDDEDQNIFGDGVNLAARIQALAEPGGIAVSRAVRDLVELRLEYAFVDGGEQTLKNVSRSVQIFHVKHAKAAVPTHTTTRMVPQVTLRFEGTDSTKTKHSFEVTLEKLMSRVRRHGDRPFRRPVRVRRGPSHRVAPPCPAARRRRSAAGRGSRLDQRHQGRRAGAEGRRADDVACRRQAPDRRRRHARAPSLVPQRHDRPHAND